MHGTWAVSKSRLKDSTLCAASAELSCTVRQQSLLARPAVQVGATSVDNDIPCCQGRRQVSGPRLEQIRHLCFLLRCTPAT